MPYGKYLFKGTVFEFARLAADIVTYWPGPKPFSVDLDRLDPDMGLYVLPFIRLQTDGQGRVKASRWELGDWQTHLIVELVDDYWRRFPDQDGWAILYNELSQRGLIKPPPYMMVTKDGRRYEIDPEAEAAAIDMIRDTESEPHLGNDNLRDFTVAAIGAQKMRDRGQLSVGSRQYGKAGRKKDKLYDQAFEKIRAGTSPTDARQWFFDQSKIIPDAGAKKAFNTAMRRRKATK